MHQVDLINFDFYPDEKRSDNGLLAIRGAITGEEDLSGIHLMLNGTRIHLKHHSVFFSPHTPGEGESTQYQKKNLFWDVLNVSGMSDQSRIHLGYAVRGKPVTRDIPPASVSWITHRQSEPDRVHSLLLRKIDQLHPDLIICMGTYCPEMSFFVRQLESILVQDFQKWILLIADDCSPPDIYQSLRDITSRYHDERILLYRNSRNLGFYHNYEGLLSRIPSAIPYVALSDQDDYWYPDKISRLIDKIRECGDMVLAFSDMKIVNPDRTVLSDTFWTYRRNHFFDLTALFFINCVTGASTLFRGALLPYLLPFPVREEASYHDHWIACVAGSAGRIGYIDSPLYEYVQHDSNIIGHEAGKTCNRDVIIALLSELTGKKKGIMTRCMKVIDRESYRVQLMSGVIRIRMRDKIDTRSVAHIRRVSRYGNTLFSVVSIYLRHILMRRKTVGLDTFLLASYLLQILIRAFPGNLNIRKLFD